VRSGRLLDLFLSRSGSESVRLRYVRRRGCRSRKYLFVRVAQNLARSRIHEMDSTARRTGHGFVGVAFGRDFVGNESLNAITRKPLLNYVTTPPGSLSGRGWTC
jgi:hypothetical protein